MSDPSEHGECSKSCKPPDLTEAQIAELRKSSNQPELTAELIVELRDAFALFDTDGDGIITPKELGAVMRSLGRAITDRELAKQLKKMKTDRQGRIHFEHFVAMMGRHNEEASHNEEELREAFQIFDRDGNGLISVDELREALKMFGDELSEEELEQLMREADINCDGQIDYEEFVIMITQI
ncbi:calmodulin-beta-like [Wyeomyia smithii]|uniref:calmodulin-beta-like n=1 Tax=Wyeomyia smithii TaxID=174621 RepID=UPI002467E7C2|nr:calmodulin-beta-like [Wyeomyia smithii]